MSQHEFFDLIRPAAIFLGIALGFRVAFNWGRRRKAERDAHMRDVTPRR